VLDDKDTCWIDVRGPTRETDKAFLYVTEIGDVWVPKSQIGGRKKNEKGEHVKIEMPKWLAENKGLI
jgi:hypothetical protein